MQTPFHKTLEMNDASINLFPLSPHYCLQIMPFEANVDPNINAMSMEIKYVQIGPEYINEINNGVFRTRNKIIISDREEALKQCIKWEKSV